jgi:hypothetical protein
LREGVALEEELKKLLEREHAQILLHLEFLHIQSNCALFTTGLISARASS